MAEQANQRQFNLKGNISLEEIISLLTELNTGSDASGNKVDKRYLETDTYPKTELQRFEITYIKEKESAEGYIDPHAVHRILKRAAAYLDYYARVVEPSLFGLLPKKDTEEYNILYFKGLYSDALFDPSNKGLQKTVISLLHEVAKSFIETKPKEEKTQSGQLDNISELSYSFRYNNGGNLEENWTNERGVKKFAEYLVTLPVSKETVVKGMDFGRNKEVYAFEHALDALSEYHKLFQTLLPNHPNYKQPKESDFEVLKKVESENYPFFSRGIFAATLISTNQLGGKIESDNKRLDEFIKLFDKTVEILKKKVEEKDKSSGSSAEEGGETTKDPDEEKKAEKIIAFESFCEIVQNTLIQFIYESLYLEQISKIDSISSRKVEARQRLISLISQGILEKLNIKLELRTVCGNGALANKYKDEKINYDTEVEQWVLEFCQGQIGQFNDQVLITNNINLIVAYLEGVPPIEEEEKTKLSEITSGSVSPLLYQYCQENEVISEGTTFEEWEKQTTTGKVNYWMSLTTHQRYEFLQKNNLIAYLKSYSVDISDEFLQLYLAKNHLTRVKKEDFAYILSMIQESVIEDLINISPAEYDSNIDSFVSKHQSEVLLIQESISIRYGFKVQKAVDDYIILNVSDIIYDQIRGKSIEEAAKIVNPEIKNINEVIHSASEGVLDILYQTYKFPNDVRLEGTDRSRSIFDIEVYLKDYLLSHPDALKYLFSATPLQRQLFFNKHIHEFWNEKSSFFVPLIEERGNERYRQVILERLTQQAGGNQAYQIQLNNNLQYLFAQAIIAQVNPEDYISALSNEDLAQLFDLPKSFDDFDEFKRLLLVYLDRSRKILKLDEAITDANKDFDTDEFTDDVLWLRQQGYGINPYYGGHVVLKSLTEALPDSEDFVDPFEAEFDAYLREDFEQQRLMTMAIWEAYSAEQRALIEEEAKNRKNILNAQQLAVYDWEKIIRSQEKDGEKGNKKGGGVIKKGIKNRTDKVISAASTTAASAAANLLIPGAGIALSGVLKALPIPEKYKKYIAGGVIGGIIGFVALTAKIFISTAGGLIGGILGALGGFMVGGFAGVIPGWAAGTWTGYGIEQAIRGAFGDFVGGVKNFFNSIGNGISNAANGLWNGVRGAWNSVFGGETSTGISASTFPSIPYGTQAAVVGSTFAGSAAVIVMQHQSYLMRAPELLNYSQDTANKYVQLTKSASPSELENGVVANITYTVTITPQAGYVITVSDVTDEITTLGTNSGDYQIDLTQIASQLPANTEISGPTTITYTMNNVSGEDVSINNEFALTFFVQDAGEIKTDTIRDTANVTIGDPELGCFVFGDSGIEVRAGTGVFSVAWSASDRSKVINAYESLLNSTKFMNLACGDGTITFYRIAGSSYGGWALSASSIGIYDLGVTSQRGADYTVIHELGHLVDYRNPGLRTSFQSIWGGSCFTYPYDCYAGEPFAEAIALYRIHSYYNFGGVGGTYNFPVLHPTEYCWIENNIYGENTSTCN